MKHFPAPLPLPQAVARTRTGRLKDLLRFSLQGMLIRFAIIVFELAGVVIFGSSALVMDALSSLIDVSSTVVLIIFIKLAARPPDEDHPFGHGRYEPLVGLQLGLLMVLMGVGLMFQQIFHLSTHHKQEFISPYAWIIPFIATLLLEFCYQTVMRASKKHKSTAMASDALHYRIDSLTSLFATIALVLAAYFPFWSGTIDHLGAIVIAGLMIFLGMQAFRNNLHQVMDKIPDAKYFEIVKTASLKVSGVHDTEKIRIQVYGPDAHVDIDIEVDPHLSVELAHSISQKVRHEIQKEWPAVRDVTVHIEPYYPNDH